MIPAELEPINAPAAALKSSAFSALIVSLMRGNLRINSVFLPIRVKKALRTAKISGEFMSGDMGLYASLLREGTSDRILSIVTAS